MTEEIKQKLRKRSTDGKISCAQAEAVAAECGISRQEIGKLINELKLKIVACQLGCF